MYSKRVEEAISEFKKGNMVIMIDDEDRENEGDLVYAANFSSPQKVNFMATHAKGLICVALSSNIARRLELDPMVLQNSSQYETAFTVSVDAKNAATGISAYERDMTIQLLASSTSRPNDLARPGHIFPLIAKDGGVLVRIGHTEGSVDLCRLSGVSPCAVICEIMREDGQMARRKDLEGFAKTHQLKTVYISDLVKFRLRNERLVRKAEESTCDFFGTKVRKIEFHDHHQKVHTAVVFYKIHATEYVKFHNVRSDIDLLFNTDRYTQMVKSIEFLQNNGGVLVFIDNQENQADNMREFGIGAQILKELGISNIKLLVSQKGKEFVGLGGFGLNIQEEILLA